jgi:threonine/homoserine/homoserine lactone efflux protein
MRELNMLFGGIVAGLTIAVPVGPVNIWCVSRTLRAGWRSGVICGLGAATADMLYGGIAGFSISFIIQFLLRELFWIRFFGAILLVVIGISYFFKKPHNLNAPKDDRSTASSDLRLTFFLTLTNPTTVLSFIAVLAALGMGQQRERWLTWLLVVGIFCGSMLWWVVLASMVNRFRDRFTDRSLLWMNRIAGIAIGGFGIATFILNRSRL